jgi:hypothetical protein
MKETTQQVIDGPIEFTEAPTVGGTPIANKASFIAISNASVTINGTSATPSFLEFDSIQGAVGIDTVSLTEGSVKNVSGRLIETMVGTISFNPDVSGGTKQLILVSETSVDNGVSWQGNLNSIRKIEISASAESFKTNVSFLLSWPDQSQLRFRAYEGGGGTVMFVEESETILAQSFTGPSIIWALGEI